MLSHLRLFPHRLKIYLYFAAALFFIALPAHSQQAQLDALAAQTAQALDKAHVKSVVVADFWSPKNSMTQLGRHLSDDFSTMLMKSGQYLEVRDRARLHQAMEQCAISALALQNHGVAALMARAVGAEAIIVGDVKQDKEQFRLSVGTYTLPKANNIANYSVKLQAPSEWETLFAAPLEEADANAPEATTKGYTPPSCVYCPIPRIPRSALELRIGGEVVLSTVIGPDGRAHDVFVLKKSTPEMDESAVMTVTGWKFKPALGPEGKSAAVHMTIVVEFHPY